MDPLAFPLSRLCYAPHPEDEAELARGGLESWVDRQLNVKILSDPDLDSRLRSFKLQIKYGAGNGQPTSNGDTKNWPAVDEMRPLRYIHAPIDAAWTLLDPKVARPGEEQARPYQELAAATILRAAHARAQLHEQLTAFWHDHFNIFFTEDNRLRAALPAFDRESIRVHAMGNFRDMLEAVAASPAMLIYLSNASSRAGAANENFARELMELHTLGRDAYLNDRYDRWRDVPGALQGNPSGYIDEDVYEAARAFTGWSIEAGQRIDAATELPRSGKFIYVDSWHDGYQKRVLASEFAPFAPPLADGRKVLDLTANHPATARFLCLKLCRRFVGDTPPQSLVDSAAKVWSDASKKPNQIAEVVKHIVLSKEFAASKAVKPRTPLALAVSVARAFEIDLTPTMPLMQQLAQCGQRLFGWSSPDGRPSTADYYLTPEYIRERWVLISRLADNTWNTGQPKALTQLPVMASKLLDDWLRKFAGSSANAHVFAKDLGIDLTQQLNEPKRIAHLASLCACAPQFQMT